MRLPFSDSNHELLEQRLRAGAPAFAPAPPVHLRARIFAALHEGPAIVPAPRREVGLRSGTWLAAAAAAFVLCSAWWLTRRVEPSVPPPAKMVAFSRELFGAGSRVLSLPNQAEGNLLLEAERLLSDTSRAAAGVVRGLPAPLRNRLERM